MENITKDIDSITPDPRNARLHPPEQIARIAGSIKEFGFLVPVLISENDQIIAGHARVEAARMAGLSEVPCVQVGHLTKTQQRAYVLADNKLAQLAEWDQAMLSTEIEELQGLDIDIESLGFSLGEIDDIIGGFEGLTDQDSLPDEVEPRTKSGDLWRLGDHRLMCGDSTSADDVAILMAGEKAGLCFTSPPYGQQRDYTEESDCSDWDGLMQGVFENLPMEDDGQVLVNLGLIHKDGEWLPYWEGWISWMREREWKMFGIYVWDQGAGMPGANHGRLAASFEIVFHFNKRPKDVLLWVECSGAGGASGAHVQRKKDGSLSGGVAGVIAPYRIADGVIRVTRAKGGIDGHPAPFPVDLPAYIVKSWPGDVYEPFSGSGTTIIACEQLGRKCRAMEISPRYCDVAVQRWEEFTGKKAKLNLDSDSGKV
jgi:DNA modification methylase